MNNVVARHLESTWAGLAHVAAMMIGSFGDPAEIFLLGFLRRVRRQEILYWLAPLEALARRLLALEAAHLPAPNVPAFVPRPGRILSGCADDAARRDSENPSEWRVRFALWPAGHPRACAPTGLKHQPITRENAVPIARRMEALLRVLEDRGPALQRMARMLAARRSAAANDFTAYRARTRVCPVETDLKETQALLDPVLQGVWCNTS